MVLFTKTFEFSLIIRVDGENDEICVVEARNPTNIGYRFLLSRV
ncbi:MAG: hypothetical protein WBA93_23990 [Microcoleaceae cyanobacterium]